MLTVTTPGVSAMARYGFAIPAAILASLLHAALYPLLGAEVPFIVFYPAVVLSVWFGGFWSGILSTALGGLIALYAFIPPAYSFTISNTNVGARLVIFVLAGTMISLLLNSRHRGTGRAEEHEIEEVEQRERFRVTLDSIGDAVIATDAVGKVTFMNRIAETLTGWTYNEASQKPVEQVFQIVHEFTRRTAEDPVERVLRDGHVVGLADHTLLLRPDGVEVPIDDSAAPIQDVSGRTVGVVLVFRDVTERWRAQRAHGMLAAIVESSEDAIISKDLEGRIMTWNVGAERLFGYREQEVIGRPIALLIPPDHVDEEAAILARIRKGERVEQYETVRVRKDGRYINVSLTVSPVRDAYGVIVGASKIAREITERKRIEQQLAEAHTQKDNFLALLAHELRNPLAPIATVVKILEITRPDDGDLLTYCHLIDTKLVQITRLLDDLLDISRITRGKLLLQKERIDLATVVMSAVETSRPIIDEAGHKLTVSLPPEPLMLEADPMRLAQVFSNLINNAVKFTEPGGDIRVAIERQEDQAVVSVKDSGVGISQELLPKIFDMFFQGSTVIERKYGGLGLGLTLARDIVEFHDGNIEARSAGFDQGSDFIVFLPLSEVPQPTERAEADSATAHVARTSANAHRSRR